MKNKKKYEKPKILDCNKIEAIAGLCPAPTGKTSPSTCSVIMS